MGPRGMSPDTFPRSEAEEPLDWLDLKKENLESVTKKDLRPPSAFAVARLSGKPSGGPARGSPVVGEPTIAKDAAEEALVGGVLPPSGTQG